MSLQTKTVRLARSVFVCNAFRKTKTVRSTQSIYKSFQTNGYTLLEVLVVILIISIVTTFATLTVKINHRRQIQEFAHLVKNLIESAETEALLRPAILGIAVGAHELKFFVYDEKLKQWQPDSQPVFKKRIFPRATEVTLLIDKKPIALGETPQIIISNNGDLANFVLSFGIANESRIAELVGEASGNVYTR